MLNRYFFVAALLAASCSVQFAFAQCSGGGQGGACMGGMQMGGGQRGMPRGGQGGQGGMMAGQPLMGPGSHFHDQMVMQQMQQQYAMRQAMIQMARQAEWGRKRELVARRAEANRQQLAEERARIRVAIAQNTAQSTAQRSSPSASGDDSELGERYYEAGKRAEAAGNDRSAQAYFALAEKRGW